MLLENLYEIGCRLFSLRKKAGLTQEELAELAGISDRTYADIERGTVNMRLKTFLRICKSLHVTPDEVLTAEDETVSLKQAELFARLDACPPRDRETALRLLSVFLQSLAK